MAAPANTSHSQSMRTREDLDKFITMQSPTATPWLSMIATDTCDSRSPEWSTESIRASDADNAAIEGDDVTNDPQTAPVVVKNHCQTFDETIGVTDIQKLVKTIDGRTELGRQLANAGKALKLDQEKRYCGNYASVASVGITTAGKAAGAQAWITTNANRGASATGGGFNSGTGLVAAHAGGTDRTFTVAIFKAAIQTGVTNGRGTLDDVIVGAPLKVAMSAFAGVVQATNEVNKGKVTILGAVDVYKSDFGFHNIHWSREMEDKSVLVVTKGTWKKTTLDSYNVVDLAKTGHSSRKLLRTTNTLKCLDEKQNVVIRNVTAA